MSTLIRHLAVEPDDYVLLADDAPLPASGKIIVSLERWRSEQASLAAGPLGVGIRIPNTVDIAAVWNEIQSAPLIALEFPAFADGRAYSQARLLAERYAYTGELRATGKAVVLDQFHFLLRCGFNSFELRDDQDAAACLAALREFTLVYQQAVDDAIPVFARRRLASH